MGEAVRMGCVRFTFPSLGGQRVGELVRKDLQSGMSPRYGQLGFSFTARAVFGLQRESARTKGFNTCPAMKLAETLRDPSRSAKSFVHFIDSKNRNENKTLSSWFFTRHPPQKSNQARGPAYTQNQYCLRNWTGTQTSPFAAQHLLAVKVKDTHMQQQK